jgi:hypothetical protein
MQSLNILYKCKRDSDIPFPYKAFWLMHAYTHTHTHTHIYIYIYIYIYITREDLFDMAISLTMDVVNPNVPGWTLDRVNIIIKVYRSSPFLKKHWLSLIAFWSLYFNTAHQTFKTIDTVTLKLCEDILQEYFVFLCDPEVNFYRQILTQYCQLKFAFHCPTFLPSGFQWPLFQSGFSQKWK